MTSSGIEYLKGDATNPLGPGPKCIVHIVNNLGRWGNGFVMALSKKWPKTREEYIRWFTDGRGFSLGGTLLTTVEPDIVVAHIIGQDGIRMGHGGPPPIRYDALEDGLLTVGETAREHQWSVHMPLIGTGLAGGDWKIIEPIILKAMVELPVTVYLLD